MWDVALVGFGCVAVAAVWWAATTPAGQRVFYALGLAALAGGLVYGAGEVGTMELGPIVLAASQLRLAAVVFVALTVLAQWFNTREAVEEEAAAQPAPRARAAARLAAR
jgi:hypothetical protein